MVRRGFPHVLVVGVLILLGTAFAAPPAGASVAQPTMVSSNPADVTPHVLDGAVSAFAQVGTTMYAGGTFTQVENANGTVTFARRNLFAFGAVSGAVRSFAPDVDGPVFALVASADGHYLYVGGQFTSVAGVAAPWLVRFDLVNNRVDRRFTPQLSGAVTDLALHSGRLLVAGKVTGALVALDPVTGADTGYLRLNISGQVASNAGRTSVDRFAINPAGTRLVALGNFTSVSGRARRQAFMAALGPTSATLTTWHVPRFDNMCGPRTPNYLKDVDFSPDGSYFAIVAAGGAHELTRFCDATGRFETSNLSSSADATWINWTGGDSLYSVAATGAAVYVGGHERWLDNPLGKNTKGPGAVDRPGIGAINPVTGKALAWDPTRTRGAGAKALFATRDGLWVGSDTERFGHEFHARIAFCPLP